MTGVTLVIGKYDFSCSRIAFGNEHSLVSTGDHGCKTYDKQDSPLHEDLHKDDLEINVTGDTLTLSGVLTRDELPEGARYHRQERNFGEFNRSIQLPYTVDVNKVKATFINGVLSVELPRVDAEVPKRISVKAS